MTPSIPGTSFVPLKGSRRCHRPGSVVLGRSDSTEWCEVTVKVRRKAPLPEPVPHQPISRAELATKYGADPKDLDTVERVLTPFGLKVSSKNSVTRAVKVVGPVSAMERAFEVRLQRNKWDGVLYRGRVGEINLPEELNGIVTGVFGLDSRPMINRRRSPGSPVSFTPPAPGLRSWYFPQELAAAYQFPAGDGTGQTVGILEFGGQYIVDDLTQFLRITGMAPAVPNVQVRNVRALSAQAQSDADYITEVMLDIEVVAGICPQATVVVFFSEWTESGWIDNLDAALTDAANLSVLSISYGLAEGNDIWTEQAMDHVNDVLKEFANAGVTVCVSSGDDGSENQVPDGSAHVNFPASSPYVLAIGGTALTRDTWQEVVWHEGDGIRQDGGGSSGGGVSTVVPRPVWQNVDIRAANPQFLQGRIVPDVAANAAANTGYFVVVLGSPQYTGGTSAAAPLWAALIARLLQAGKQVGFLTPLLYQPLAGTGGQPLGAVACFDVTQGSNASGNAPGYAAGVGFDAATGWGSPNGAQLLNLLS